MNPIEYWRLKAKLAEVELERTQLEMALQQVYMRKSQLLIENGLDPNVNYRFNDETFEVVEMK